MINKRYSASFNTFLIVIIYAVCFYAIQFFLCRIEVLHTYPSIKNIASWDAGWYQNIVNNGYQKGSLNNAFFPLFPLLWHILHVNVVGICIVNIILFASGFTILSNLFDIQTVDKLIWLSVPSLYFVFVPYTEALFFLLISCCFYGIFHKKRWLIYISLFLVSLTRATAVFLLPAFLIMELLATTKILSAIKNFLLIYALPIVLGLLCFMYYQYIITGSWFTYFTLQSTNWGHKFSLPTLPFSTMEGFKRIWLSALGMFVGFTSMVSVVIFLFRRVFRKKIYENRLLSLSFLYLSAIVVLTAFYNPIWGTYTTNLMGMHRYTMATPFFFIFLFHFTHNINYKLYHFFIAFIIANVAWLLCGAYVHILAFLFFTFNTILIFIYMAYANKKLTWPPLIIFALNVILQLSMMQQFISIIYPD